MTAENREEIDVAFQSTFDEETRRHSFEDEVYFVSFLEKKNTPNKGKMRRKGLFKKTEERAFGGSSWRTNFMSSITPLAYLRDTCFFFSDIQ